MAQEKATDPFYFSEEWKNARRVALWRDNGMCVRCMERYKNGGSRPRRATVVHHIKHLEEYPDMALELDNLESLCGVCHNQAHPEKGAKKASPAPAPDISRGVRIIKI